MKNKTPIITILLTLFLSINLFSQHKDSRKKIKVLKVSFITEKLNLSEQEAAKFWPIYNRFEKKRYELYHVRRTSLKKKIETLGGIDKLSEKEAKNFANDMLKLEKSKYETDINYQKELSKIISYKKIIKLHLLERDFNRRLFRRYKKQKVRRPKKENK